MKYVNTGLYYYCLNLGRALQQRAAAGELNLFGPCRIRSAFDHTAPLLPQHSLQKFFMPSLNGFDITPTFVIGRFSSFALIAVGVWSLVS